MKCFIWIFYSKLKYMTDSLFTVLVIWLPLHDQHRQVKGSVHGSKSIYWENILKYQNLKKIMLCSITCDILYHSKFIDTRYNIFQYAHIIIWKMYGYAKCFHYCHDVSISNIYYYLQILFYFTIFWLLNAVLHP